MAINLWRRHRRVRVGRAALGERYIKDAEAQSAARLRGLAEKRKLIERRLEDAREELAHIKDAFAGTLSTEHAQLWLLVPLLVLGLVLAVGSNLWALEPFMALEGWKRLGLSISLPVLSLIGGLAAGNGLRMPKGAPLRKVYFGVGFTVLSVIIVGVLSLNLVRGLDMTEQEQHRRASLNTTEDLDANKQEGVADASPHKNLMTALITLTSTTMGVGGELASAFAFDQLVILFIPVFTMARLRGRVRRLENKFVEIVCEEENARRPELGRAIVAAEETEVVEFQEATENKDHEMNKKKDDDDSLVPLAWRITGIVLIVATLIFISMTFAFGGTQIAVHTVILIDLSTSVEPNDEFNRDRAAVAGIIKRIKDAGHRIAVFGITESSFGQPALLTSVSPIETGRYGEYLEGWNTSVSAKWQKVSSGLSPSAKCTDLFGAIARAAIEFEESPASKKELVILSDMRQACRGYNFEKSLDDVNLLVERVERERLIPRLDSVEVWVLGAHTTGINEKHWSKLKLFFTEYFKRSGATLKSFSPNRRLGELGGNQ